MLRLLFTTKDLSKQMTVITDGVDSQMNVFVTENTVGDVDYYKSLGIVIKAGITYNIGKFIEWCLANELGLIGYPEGLEDEEIVYVNVLDRTEYILDIETTELNFKNTGESKNFVVTSSKQEFKDGAPYGDPKAVEIEIQIQGDGFTGNAGVSQISASENPTNQIRKGVAIIIQKESGKRGTIALEQAASVITYENTITANNMTLAFDPAGEDLLVTITSKRQKKLNGKNSGSAVDIPFNYKIMGAGFSYKGLSGKTYTIAASENTNETTGRNGTLVVTQTGDGAKSVTITLTQSKANVTYEYNLKSSESNIQFIAAGETKTLPISCNKQKVVNGKDSGELIAVTYTTVVTGTGFTKGATEYSVVAAANTGAQRTGKATVTALEGGKKIDITLTQAAGATA